MARRTFDMSAGRSRSVGRRDLGAPFGISRLKLGARELAFQRASIGLWAAIAVGFVLTVAWPFLNAAVLLSDDTEMLLAHLGDPGRFHGWQRGFFRPLDTLSSLLIDPASRDSTFALLLHVPAVLAIGAAIGRGLKKVTPDYGLAWPVAMVWWALSVATTIAIWQPDTISQTWSGAAGCWLMLAVWDGIEEVKRGWLPARRILLIIAICLLGILTKEFFLGWAAGAAALVFLAFVVERDARRLSRVADWAKLVVPVVVIPAAFLYLRIAYGGLGRTLAEPETDGQYDIRLGMNVLINLAVTALGLTSVGPAHMVDNPNAWLPVRAAPLLGSVLTALLIVSPWLLVRFLKTGRHYLDDWRLLLVVVIMAISGVASAIPTGHVSEYYLFGPNAGIAALVGLGVTRSLRIIAEARPGRVRAAGRLLFALVLASIVGVGLLGSVSRASHIALNWDYVRRINAAVSDYYQRAPVTANKIDVFVPARFQQGPTHGVFVSTPAHLYDFALSAKYLNESVPTPKIQFVFGRPSTLGPGQYSLEIDLPPRPRW